VYGAGFSNFHEGTSLINKIEPADPRYINILLVHGTVDLDFKDSRYNPMSSGELALLAWIILLWGIFIILCGVLERVKTYTTPEARNLWDLMRRGSTVSLLAE